MGGTQGDLILRGPPGESNGQMKVWPCTIGNLFSHFDMERTTQRFNEHFRAGEQE